MSWEVVIGHTARKYLQKITPHKKEQLLRSIKELNYWLENKTYGYQDIKALKGEWAGHYRLRVGNTRIIFQVIHEENLLKIINIGPRGDIY